jgi:transposase
MPVERRRPVMTVVCGIDSHKRTLAAAAVDEVGRVLDVAQFTNSDAGHGQLETWASAHGVSRIGVEGSGSYGAGACRHLLVAGHDVREVPAFLTHRERKKRPSKGKSDPTDAIAIARVVAREEPLFSVERSPILEDLKLLSDHHDQLKRARNQTANRTHRCLVALDPAYHERIPNLTAAKHIASVLKLLRGNKSVRAELIRSYVRELRRLDAELKVIRGQIALKVKESATTLTELRGVGPVLAAKILGEVGDIGRIRSKAAFAMLNGSAPLLASSGVTNRHRLNRGGNRQLNSALHMIAVSCLRTDPDTRAYVARRTGEGKSKREALRCLKRHLSNVVYRQMLPELRELAIAA